MNTTHRPLSAPAEEIARAILEEGYPREVTDAEVQEGIDTFGYAATVAEVRAAMASLEAENEQAEAEANAQEAADVAAEVAAEHAQEGARS